MISVHGLFYLPRTNCLLPLIAVTKNRNIIVNAIAPGPFDSHMLGKAVNFDYSFIAESVPRKRIGSPEDIAGLCIYLCSRAGAYTIGETITCDGGLAKLL